MAKIQPKARGLIVMVKRNLMATLLTTLFAYATGKIRHAHTRSDNYTGHDNLTADEREQIAEQIRAIATRAVEEYRRRREPVPPYVLSALDCGRESRWRGSVSTLKPHFWERFRIPKSALLRALPAIALLVLVPIVVLRYRQPVKDSEYRQVQQQLQMVKQELEQQNGDLSREIETISVYAIPAEEFEKHRNQEQVHYYILKKKADQGRLEMTALRNEVRAANALHRLSRFHWVLLDDYGQTQLVAAQNKGPSGPRLLLATQPQRMNQQGAFCLNPSSSQYEGNIVNSESDLQDQLKLVSQRPATTLGADPRQLAAPIVMSVSNPQLGVNNKHAAPEASILSKDVPQW